MRRYDLAFDWKQAMWKGDMEVDYPCLALHGLKVMTVLWRNAVGLAEEGLSHCLQGARVIHIQTGKMTKNGQAGGSYMHGEARSGRYSLFV